MIGMVDERIPSVVHVRLVRMKYKIWSSVLKVKKYSLYFVQKNSINTMYIVFKIITSEWWV